MSNKIKYLKSWKQVLITGYLSHVTHYTVTSNEWWVMSNKIKYLKSWKQLLITGYLSPVTHYTVTSNEWWVMSLISEIMKIGTYYRLLITCYTLYSDK